MYHARIAFFKCKPGVIDEEINKSKEELLPFNRSQPGFIAYGVIKFNDDEGVSIGLWETQAQAENAVQTNMAWVNNNVSELIESVQNHVGSVSFFSSVKAIEE